MSTKLSTPPESPVDERTQRQIGWSFIVAFAVFSVMVPFVFLSPMNTEVFAEQSRRGVGVDGLPVEVYAEIALRHYVDTVPLLLGTLLGMVGFSAAAVLAAGRVAVRPWSRRLLTVAGAGVSVAWIAAAAVDGVMMYATAGWVAQHYYAVYAGVQAVVSGLACLTLVVLGLELRHQGVLPRFGLVLAVLATAGLIGAVAVGVPPVLGLLLGAILGALLIRRAGRPASVLSGGRRSSRTR